MWHMIGVDMEVDGNVRPFLVTRENILERVRAVKSS